MSVIDKLFTNSRAWFSIDIQSSVINQFEFYGGTVALDITNGNITHYISDTTSDPVTQELITTTNNYIITSRWIVDCIQYQSIQSIAKYILPPVIQPNKQSSTASVVTSDSAQLLSASLQTSLATSVVIDDERQQRYAAQKQKRALNKLQHHNIEQTELPDKLQQPHAHITADDIINTTSPAHAYSSDEIQQLNMNIYENNRVIKRKSVSLKILIPFPQPQTSQALTDIILDDLFEPITIPYPNTQSQTIVTHNNNHHNDMNQIQSDDVESIHDDTDQQSISQYADDDGSSARSTPIKLPQRPKRRKK